MTADIARSTSRLLGIAGLIPFLVPALLAVAGSPNAALAGDIAGAYALAIICFLTGSWWGMAQPDGGRATLILSNLYLLLALSCYLALPTWWPLLAALLLLGAWACEQSAALFPDLGPAYRRLRNLLTPIAAASMLVLQFAIPGVVGTA